MFVLMSQNRMTRQADKRARLDLQIDLLAEQELTTILHMLRALCKKHKVEAISLMTWSGISLGISTCTSSRQSSTSAYLTSRALRGQANVCADRASGPIGKRAGC